MRKYKRRCQGLYTANDRYMTEKMRKYSATNVLHRNLSEKKSGFNIIHDDLVFILHFGYIPFYMLN